jgi:hypothetical protein
MPIDMEVQEFDILDWYQNIPFSERIYSHPMIKKQIESLNLINTIRNSNHVMYKAALCFSYDIKDLPFNKFDSEYISKVQVFIDGLDGEDIETKLLVAIALNSETIKTALKSLAFVRFNSVECYDITISILSKINKKPFSTTEMADCYTEKMKTFLQI